MKNFDYEMENLDHLKPPTKNFDHLKNGNFTSRPSAAEGMAHARVVIEAMPADQRYWAYTAMNVAINSILDELTREVYPIKENT